MFERAAPPMIFFPAPSARQRARGAQGPASAGLRGPGYAWAATVSTENPFRLQKKLPEQAGTAMTVLPICDEKTCFRNKTST